MRFYSAVVWRHQLSQFGGPFKAAADQTTGSRIFCPCSTPGPGECKADLPGKHVHTGILLDRCASLFVQGTRGPGHGPHMAFMLPCMIGMERWVNILLVASFHEHWLPVLCTWPQHWTALKGSVPLVSSRKGIADNFSQHPAAKSMPKILHNYVK